MRSSVYDKFEEVSTGTVCTAEPRISSLQTILMEQREMVVDLYGKLLDLDRHVLPSVNDADRNGNKRDESNVINFAIGTTDTLAECHVIINNLMTNLFGA